MKPSVAETIIVGLLVTIIGGVAVEWIKNRLFPTAPGGTNATTKPPGDPRGGRKSASAEPLTPRNTSVKRTIATLDPALTVRGGEAVVQLRQGFAFTTGTAMNGDADISICGTDTLCSANGIFDLGSRDIASIREAPLPFEYHFARPNEKRFWFPFLYPASAGSNEGSLYASGSPLLGGHTYSVKLGRNGPFGLFQILDIRKEVNGFVIESFSVSAKYLLQTNGTRQFR